MGATPELLGSIHPGLIARDTTAEALAEAANRLLDDPVALAEIGGRCRARVAPAMGWETIAHRYLDAYHALLAARSSAP